MVCPVIYEPRVQFRIDRIPIDREAIHGQSLDRSEMRVSFSSRRRAIRISVYRRTLLNASLLFRFLFPLCSVSFDKSHSNRLHFILGERERTVIKIIGVAPFLAVRRMRLRGGNLEKDEKRHTDDPLSPRYRR